MTHDLNDPILERRFEALDAEGNSDTITLRVGKPYFALESDSSLQWRGPYQTVGIGSERVKEARGMDSLDALMVCLRIADARLQSDGRSYRKKITFLGEEILSLYHPFQIQFPEQDKSTLENDDSPFKEIFDRFFRERRSRETPPENPEQSE